MHKLDVLFLGELGELGIGLDAVLPLEGDVKAWIAMLLQNNAAQPVDIVATSSSLSSYTGGLESAASSCPPHTRGVLLVKLHART